MLTLLLSVSTLWTLVGLFALWRVRHREATLADTPVTVFKPLRGADAALESNLRTFFEQDHPDFELVFGIEGDADPAEAVVRSLMLEFPEVRATLVTHGGPSRVPNPKVRNLLAMRGSARNDLVVISDSNIAAPRHYLREIAGAFDDPSVGLATHLISADGAHDIGSTIESLHLNGFVAPAVATADLSGVTAVIGKSMAFRLSDVDALGGLVSVGHVLAEDLVLGQMLARAGHRVVVCPTPIVNVIGPLTPREFVRRQARWGGLRLRLTRVPYLLEPLAYPLAFVVAAPLFGVDGRALLAWAVGLTLLRDGCCWWILRGRSGLLRALPLAPLRDLLALSAWVVAPIRRHVSWRGHRLRIGPGTRLYVEAKPASRVARLRF